MKRKEKVIWTSSNDDIVHVYEDGKIIGSGSIRLNPEIDEYTEKVCGHLFYQIIPSKRGKGYGTILCHLLLEKMKELGFKEALISCFDTNIGSIKIIENNSGKFIEYYIDEDEQNPEYRKNRRYKFDIEKSLEEFSTKQHFWVFYDIIIFYFNLIYRFIVIYAWFYNTVYFFKFFFSYVDSYSGVY